MNFNSEMEKKFEKYRLYLKDEASRLASYIALYRRLHERRKDRLYEMNIAPAFFQVTIDALISSIILWVDKLFDKNSERGIYNFIAFNKKNIDIFAIEQLQRRKNYSDDHWMLKREPVTIETIREDKKRIKGLLCLKNFKTRRNKFYAHFDEDYFFDPERLADDAPLTWGDFNNVIELLSEIIDRYSSAYDGQLFPLKPININDVDYLLDRLHMAVGPVRDWAGVRINANADAMAKDTATEAMGEEPGEK